MHVIYVHPPIHRTVEGILTQRKGQHLFPRGDIPAMLDLVYQ